MPKGTVSASYCKHNTTYSVLCYNLLMEEVSKWRSKKEKNKSTISFPLYICKLSIISCWLYINWLLIISCFYIHMLSIFSSSLYIHMLLIISCSLYIHRLLIISCSLYIQKFQWHHHLSVCDLLLNASHSTNHVLNCAVLPSQHSCMSFLLVWKHTTHHLANGKL